MKQFSVPLFAVAALLPGCLCAPDLSARAVSCGVNGYDHTEGYGWSKKGTYDACALACSKDSKNCKSFSFGNNECNLYNVAVAGNLAKDKNSPYLFYDISCVASSSTTSKTTTTTTTTTTKAAVKTTTTSTGKVLPTTSKAATTTTSAVPITTKAATTTTAVTTTLTSSTLKTPPCAVPTWIVSDFVYFNSAHNLDCAGSDFDNPLCYTGRDPQPAGYGPPDSVSASISEIGYCHQQNPGTTPRRGVGNDVVRCSGSSYQFAFYGSSVNATSTAHIDIQNPFTCPDGSGWGANGGLDFQMNCVYDSGKNATCTPANGQIKVPATFWGCVYGCGDDN